MTTRTTTRRAVLAGVPAVALAPAVAIASTGDDAELLALLRKAEALRKASIEVSEATERASRLAERHYPPAPQLTKPPAEHAHIWEKEPSYKFQMLPEDHPLKLWYTLSYQPEEPLRRAHSEACKKVNEQFRIAELEAEFGDLCGEVWDVVLQIIAMPARTPAGMLAKVRGLELTGSINDEDDIEFATLHSIAADISRMAVQS